MEIKFIVESDYCAKSILVMWLCCLLACRERWENLEREDVKENLVLRFLCGYTSYSVQSKPIITIHCYFV